MTTPRNPNPTPRRRQRSAPPPSKWQLWCALGLIAIGSVLLIAGFMVPPEGEIHSSVLVAFGEILTFSGALFGIDYHYKYRS